MIRSHQAGWIYGRFLSTCSWKYLVVFILLGFTQNSRCGPIRQCLLGKVRSPDKVPCNLCSSAKLALQPGKSFFCFRYRLSSCLSLFPIPYSQFPVPYFLFPIPYSLFPPGSPAASLPGVIVPWFSGAPNTPLLRAGGVFPMHPGEAGASAVKIVHLGLPWTFPLSRCA